MDSAHNLSKANGHKLKNGEYIPVLGFGTWNTVGTDAYDYVIMALDTGVRLIDTAFVYLNENEVGKAIKHKIDEGLIKREDIFITTKLWNTHHHPDLVKGACMQSLTNLGVDYIDLYLMHNPYSFREGCELYPRDEHNEIIGSDVDFIDTWQEMEKLYTSGLVKNIGVSNFNELQLIRLLRLCEHRPSVAQFECHPFLTNYDLSTFCKKHDIMVMAFGPLGSPERPIQFTGEPKLLHNATVATLAKKYNKSPAQMLIRYQLQRGHIPIPKSELPEFALENTNVFDFVISLEDMCRLDSLNIYRRFVNVLSCMKLPEYPFHDDIRYGDQPTDFNRC
ncbi:hypothetical protein HA402_003652 [Bradysia odoriphaga]|nr:hypothetical protein HA402_003652 [Bradysia odoriphaga]